MGLYQDKHRSCSEGGRTKKSRVPSCTPECQSQKGRDSAACISRCSVFFGIIPMGLQLKGRRSLGTDTERESEGGVGWGTMRNFQCQATTSFLEQQGAREGMAGGRTR